MDKKITEDPELEHLGVALNCEHENWYFITIDKEERMKCENCKEELRRCLSCSRLLNDSQGIAASSYGGITTELNFLSENGEKICCGNCWDDYIFKGMVKHLLHTTVYGGRERMANFEAAYAMLEALIGTLPIKRKPMRRKHA